MWKNDEDFWVGGEGRSPRMGMSQPVCARSHGRLRKFKRTAARVGVSGELAAALEGGAAALSVSEDFNDIFDLGT